MQKATLIFLVTIVAVAITVPIFADIVPNPFAANDTNSSANNSTGNNSTIDNSTLTNSTNSTNSTLAPQQLQTLTDTQSKLTALIATIEGLKTTYGNNTKAKGLLNALDQFEKQANKLNSEITAFIQNPTAENSTIEASNIDGKINSFVKREAALEHKVAIKQQLLAKLGTQGTNTKVNKNSKKNKTKQNKGHNK